MDNQAPGTGVQPTMPTPPEDTIVFQETSPIVASESTPAVTTEIPSHMKSGSVHGFLFVVQFFALWMMTSAVGTLFFQLINHYIDDPLLSAGMYDYVTSSFSQYAAKFGIASIMVAAPTYYLLAFFLNRALKRGAVSYESRARKWVVSIVLIIASLVLMGDLISLIYGFLTGDYSGRFIPKVLVIFLLGGLTLGYYVVELIRKDTYSWTRFFNWIFFGVGLFFVLLAFFWSFVLIDSPSATRDRKADAETISKLRTVSNAIEAYSETSGLPMILSDLIASSSSTTTRRYGANLTEEQMKGVNYTKISEVSYKLCATFRAASETDSKKKQSDLYSYYDYNDEWKHEKGEQCFTKTVKPQYKAPVYPTNSIWMNGDGVQQYTSPEGTTQSLAPTDAGRPPYGSQYGTQPSTPSSSSRLIALARSAQVSAILCRDSGGTVQSGLSGASLCSTGGSVWPSLSSICNGGQWTVKNGSTDQWDFVLECNQVPQCTGPQNFICSETTCQSPSGACAS